jgi:hypothetical protein
MFHVYIVTQVSRFEDFELEILEENAQTRIEVVILIG